MKLTELLTSPWAILPDSLREIQQIYATHLKGDKIDLAAVEARLGRPLANEAVRYELRNGVAVLPVEGILAPKANLFTAISGGASYQMLAQQVQGAIADSRVKAIIQYADTPGGSVAGMYEYGALLAEAAKIKPIVTVSDGKVASAGYLAASATNAIFLTGPAVNAGSIGIYARMANEPAQTGVMEFARGKYKRASLNGAAPSAEFMAYFEGQLDYQYTTFVDHVAAYRRTSSQQVLDHMAEGRVFIGQQAIDAGLADGFATVDDIVERMATNPAQFANRRKAVFALGGLSIEPAGALAGDTTQPTEPVLLGAPATTEGNPPMKPTREQIAAEAPELLQAILAEGATAERERIQAVEAQLIPGHEALIASLKFDGKSGPGEAAMAINAAERNLRTAAAQAAAAEAPKPVAIVPSQTITAVLPSATEQAAAAAASTGVDATLPLEERCQAVWDKDASVRTEFSSIGAFTAYTRATEEGRAKVFARS
jgi:capsid assembly protease